MPTQTHDSGFSFTTHQHCFSGALRKLASTSTQIPLLPVVINGLLSERFVAHDLDIKQLVNPDDKELVYVYGASGGCAARFLLSTNASIGYFIDHSGISASTLTQALEQADWSSHPQRKLYRDHKSEFGFSLAPDRPRQLAKDLLLELHDLGVRHGINLREQIKVTLQPDDQTTTIEFKWAFPGGRVRARKIVFIHADLLDSQRHLHILDRRHPKGLDGYYQMASYNLLNAASRYLPALMQRIKPGGFMLLDTRQQHGGEYSLKKAIEISARTTSDVLRSAEHPALTARFKNELRYYGQAVRPIQVF